MVVLIIYIIIIVFIVKYAIKASRSPYSLLYNVLVTQQFSNISNVYSTSSLAIIRADNNGENYVFAAKKDNTSLYSVADIEKIYSIAQGLHVHTAIIATVNPITTSSPIYRKIREYKIDVWDSQKLTALATEMTSANSSHNYSTLRTSDTSDDTCKIDTNSVDPIQETTLKPHSLFSGLFDKPEHL